MSDQILLNRIRTPDGTVLTSYSRHDCVMHEDKVSGEVYMVDGGTSYARRSVNKTPAEDLTVYLTDDHEANRKAFHWGTYGKRGNCLLKYVPLAELESDHIEAVVRSIFRLNPHPKTTWVVNLLRAELDYRNGKRKQTPSAASA